MEKEQPYDPFEFDEDSIDKTFRKGFVMDTGMEAANPFTPAQPRIGDAPPPVVEKPKPKEKPRKKKLNIKKKMKNAIKKKREKMS